MNPALRHTRGTEVAIRAIVISPPPQVYALGNFSKFVRPGYFRAQVTGAPKASASAPLVVAFTNESDGTGTPISLSAGRFAASLGAQSVTTFVGKP